jgi:hypothetical protein
MITNQKAIEYMTKQLTIILADPTGKNREFVPALRKSIDTLSSTKLADLKQIQKIAREAGDQVACRQVGKLISQRFFPN